MKTANTLPRTALALLLAVSMTVTSCDVLDIEPTQEVSSEVALEDLAGFRAVLGSTYDDLQDVSYYGQYYMLYPDALADNIQQTASGGARYDGPPVNAIGAHMNRWGLHYDSINKTNLILTNLGNLEGNVDDASVIERVEGEARFLRALNYFDLMRTKAYEPGSIADACNIEVCDQGVVIRTEPTVTTEEALNFQARSSIGAVYELIKDDLEQAITLMEGTDPLFTGVDGPSQQFVANVAAAQALLAQVLLYEKSYAEAASMADAALSTAESLLGATLLTEDEYVEALSGSTNPSGIFTINMQANLDGDATNANESIASLTYDLNSFNFQLLPTQDLIDAHESTDVRLGLFETGVSSSGEEIMRMAKYTGAEAPFTDDIVVLRYAEVLLIRAEARAESGDGSGALADLNALRTERGLEEVSVSGNGLIEEILTQKRLELAYEGERFFDLKRRSMNIPKPQPQAASDVLPYNDFRILAQISANDVELNAQLLQNRGY